MRVTLKAEGLGDQMVSARALSLVKNSRLGIRLELALDSGPMTYLETSMALSWVLPRA